MVKLPGFSKDIKASREEAKKLLAEAGQSNLKFLLWNRNLAMPYTPAGIFLVDQWRQIGVEVEHKQSDTAPYLATMNAGNHDVAIDFSNLFMDDSSLGLAKYLSFERAPENRSRSKDPELDKLYDEHLRERDPEKRKAMIRAFEKRLFEQAYQQPLLWWHRIVPTHKTVMGWKMSPSHNLGARIWPRCLVERVRNALSVERAAASGWAATRLGAFGLAPRSNEDCKMLRYTINRVLLMIPTLIGVAVLVFFMLRVVPGDVVEVKLRGDGGTVSQETIDMERRRLGLDKPLVYQFGDWMIGLAKLDLGKSMWTERPVIEEIAIRLELSLEVAILATIFATLISVPLGTMAALFRGTWIDYVVRIVTIGGLSIPSFWFGMLIILSLLSFFNWLPPITFTPIYVDPVANLSQLIWPAMAVGYRYCAVTARMIRSSLLEVMSEDYIRTARAKGVFEKLVVSRHALRNALLPAITVMGLEFAFLIGGLVVTEQVFNLNGIGMLFVQSVSRNDFTLIQGMVMLIAAFYVFINLVVDLLYAVFDPRIRYG